MSLESNEDRIIRLEEQFNEVLGILKGVVGFMDNQRQSILQLALVVSHLLEEINALKTEVVSRARLAAETQSGDPAQHRRILDSVSKIESQLDASVITLAQTREKIAKLMGLEPPLTGDSGTAPPIGS